jgi:2-amino-4-hydroxy-6-hydroxymethyldihydropteridine diphosphokinase
VGNTIYIALGSNIGDRELNLLLAVAEIAKIPDSRVTALSSFYDSEPVGMVATAHFLNAVLRMESSLTPEVLLAELMRIESEIFQRTRRGGVASRRMDLDILFYGSALIDRPPALVIPHPRLHDRRFVLAPLAEIAPEFMHPLLQKTVSTLLGELEDSSQVIKV